MRSVKTIEEIRAVIPKGYRVWGMSFRGDPNVLIVQDDKGHRLYVAVEVDDVPRAIQVIGNEITEFY